MIHTGDAIEVMRGMEAESVDAVVTDPPYNLSFMGKEWDAFGGVASQVLSPAMEAASNGYFKGRGMRAANGPAFQAWCTEWGTEALRVTKPGGYLLAFGGTRTHHRLVCGLEDAGWIIRDELNWIYASGFPKGKANLKPAHEPIVLARKPGPLRALAIDECRIATSEELSFGSREIGTNGVYRPIAKERQTDGEQHPSGRWPSNVLLQDAELFDEPNPGIIGSGGSEDGAGYSRFFTIPQGKEWKHVEFPTALIVPKADRAEREPVLRGQLEAAKARVANGPETQKECPECGHRFIGSDGYPTCGHKKFIYVKQVNAPRTNSHPTVKPLDLMRHLVRLVTPPGGTVLDCFLGSGTTAIACELEGFPWIGIEKEPGYVAIAEARLNGIQKGLGLAL